MFNPYAIISFILTIVQVLLGTASVYSLVNQAIMIAIPLMFSIYIVSFIKFYIERKNKTEIACC